MRRDQELAISLELACTGHDIPSAINTWLREIRTKHGLSAEREAMIFALQKFAAHYEMRNRGKR